jgi:hypothetical protein
MVLYIISCVCRVRLSQVPHSSHQERLLFPHQNESHPNNVAKYWCECGQYKVRVLFYFVWGGLESGKLMVFNISWCVCRVRLVKVCLG